ncbi:unnamed protein product [Closterium sp. NIES-54]
MVKRPKTGQQVCKECFFRLFESEIHATIVLNKLFKRGEKVAVAASGGKVAPLLSAPPPHAPCASPPITGIGATTSRNSLSSTPSSSSSPTATTPSFSSSSFLPTTSSVPPPSPPSGPTAAFPSAGGPWELHTC